MYRTLIITTVVLTCCLAAAHAQVVFQKTYGGADVDAGNFVHPTDDGGYVIAGYTESYGNPGGWGDMYMMKVDGKGTILWTKTFGGADDEFFRGAAYTADGGYAISAYTYSFAATGWADIYVIKTDSGGNMLWSKNYGLAGNYENGGTICPTADSGLLIVGYVATPNEDIFLIKTDINGDTMWTKVLGTGVAEHPTYVRQTQDGGYIITGIRDDTINGGHDIFLLKTNNTSNVQWAKLYGGNQDEYGEFVEQTNDNGYIIGGWTESFGAGKRDIYPGFYNKK